ncbi:MAG: hypothetical protein U0234_10030 [Sandaracinus sp.]
MPSAPSLDLTKVDFDAGLPALRARAHDPAGRLRLAEWLSLSAIRGAYQPALARIAEARALDPSSPRHRLREALTHLRFGQTARASEVLEALPESVRHGEEVAMLRALAALQEGELKRAKNIASELADAAPTRHAAKFVALDAQMRVALKGSERRLGELPREPGTEAPWADLLVKIAMLRPEDTRAVTQQLEARKVLPKEGAERAAVDEMLAMGALDLPALIERVRAAEAGSRFEELLLVRLGAKLAEKPRAEALALLRELHSALPRRASVRRLFVSALTQHAVEEASQSRFEEALRAVEPCIRLEPHERMHLQNRAALLTLMSDRDAAEHAWLELERHQARLALAGAFEPAVLALPHRMVAQQARLSPAKPPRAVFKLDVLPGAKDGGALHLLVDQAYVDRDPERLRQWIHHRAAELVFTHAALGKGALLEPLDRAEAEERAQALHELGHSLRVLVGGEGERLAEALDGAFRKLAARARHRYDAPVPSEAQKDLARAHLETLGDVALLCLTYDPGPDARPIVDEILRLLRGVAPFLDTKLLAEAQRKSTADTPDALPRLEGVLRRLLSVELGELAVGLPERRRLRAFLSAQLEVAWVAARLRAQPNPSHAETERLLGVLDRAERESPGDPVVLYWSARVALMGSLFDDVPRYVSAFHRALKGQHHPLVERIEELEETLAKYRSAGVEGRKHVDLGPLSDARSAERGEAELVQELDRQPTAIRLYEQLVRLLLIDARFGEAETWADRAVARCLSAASQRKARALHLDVLGLAALARVLGDRGGADPALRAYAQGARAAAQATLAKVEIGAGGYVLEHLRGQVLLAAGEREQAQAAFRRALAACDRGMHMVLLRPLAASLDSVLVERLQTSVDPLIAAGQHAAALARVTEAMREMSEPEHALALLAGIQHAAALAALAPGARAVLVEASSLPPALASKLGASLRGDGSARARALAELAVQLSPTSQAPARSILRRVEQAETQRALAGTLEKAHAMTEAGQIDAALALLGALPAPQREDPRVVRQEALSLLRAHRHEDADAAVARLASSEHPIAVELRERWPALCFKHRLAAAQRALRAGELARAGTLLASTTAPGEDEALSLAYTVGFHGAMLAEAAEKNGAHDEAQHAIAVALDAIERVKSKARERGRDDLLKLYEQLEQRSAIVERSRKAGR